MAFYKLEQSEWPIKPETMLRFFYLSAVRRQQCGAEKISFSKGTQVTVVIPESTEILPHINITCPKTGNTLRLNILVTPERELVTRNDAIAYFMRVMFKEGIKITQRDISDLDRYPSRKYYTHEFYTTLLNKLSNSAKSFATYNCYANSN